MTEKKLGQTMGRGDFFKWGFQSIKEKTIEGALKSLNNVNTLASLTEEKWEKVALLEQLSERPKSVFLKGVSFYIVLVGQDVKAYKTVCPVDAKQLQWQEHLQRFHCLHCKTSFNLEGQIVEAQTASQMQESRVKWEEGIIYLNLD